METGERLSAYLAGELDTDETRALEAELARDPALRSRLARLRVLESELADLPAVEPSADFSARLRTAVQDELAATPLPGDELGRRRAAKRDRMPQWLPIAAGAAAALVVVVGGVGVFSNVFGGGDDAATMAEDGAADEAAGAGLAGDSVAAEMAEADTAAGPVIVVNDASYDEASLQALPSAELFQGIVGERLASGTAADAAWNFLRALPDSTRQAVEESGGEDATESGETSVAQGGSPADLQTIGGPLDQEAAADIGRCLPEILESADTLIPVYVELARFADEDVIVYGFASLDRETEEYTRIEVWAVSRADCAQLFFSQQDR